MKTCANGAACVHGAWQRFRSHLDGLGDARLRIKLKIVPTNRLAQEKSPYLLQHAHNPVDWYPWGEEAFAKAQREDKPIFLSVGYSTCHWCHVMERESFESEEIARVLNENFVSVKVDREERPDVDRMYMLFVQASTGSGGWPMSVWLTPERKPFFGGTYFPPDNRYGRPGFPRGAGATGASLAAGSRARSRSPGDKVIEQLREYSSLGAAIATARGAKCWIARSRRSGGCSMRGWAGSAGAQVSAAQRPQFSVALLRGDQATKKRWRWC